MGGVPKETFWVSFISLTVFEGKRTGRMASILFRVEAEFVREVLGEVVLHVGVDGARLGEPRLVDLGRGVLEGVRSGRRARVADVLEVPRVRGRGLGAPSTG